MSLQWGAVNTNTVHLICSDANLDHHAAQGTMTTGPEVVVAHLALDAAGRLSSAAGHDAILREFV